MPGWAVAETEQLHTLLQSIDAALDQLGAAPWQRVSDDDLLELTQRLEKVSRRCQAPQLAVTQEITERGIPDQRGFSSTGKFLSDLLTITTTEAGGRVRAAKMLLPRDTLTAGELPPLLPATAAAVSAGGVGPDQLRIITRTMAAIPTSVDETTRELCEATLVAEAAYRPAPELQVVADQITCRVNPDGSDQDLDQADRAEFTIGSQRGDGLTPVRGLLDKLAVEHLRQAIEPLAAPKPADDGRPDARSAGTRRAQALAELVRRWLGLGESPTSRGVRPHATIICTLDQLRDGVGAALLDYAGTAGAGLTRLLTCDADIALHAVDELGRFIDGSKDFRLFNPAQRRALAVRDGGCAWPGCDVPAAWTDAHHIQHWAHGGKTELDNAVLLCGYHHGFIHRATTEWQIRLNPHDRKPEFLPPRWIDPEQKPRRNRLHDLQSIKIRIPGPAAMRS